jgi:hypothetical protein
MLSRSPFYESMHTSAKHMQRSLLVSKTSLLHKLGLSFPARGLYALHATVVPAPKPVGTMSSTSVPGPAAGAHVAARDSTAETDQRGDFKRTASTFRDAVTADGRSGFPAEAGRYIL